MYRQRHLKGLKMFECLKSQLFFFFFPVYDLIKTCSLSGITTQSCNSALAGLCLITDVHRFHIQTNVVKAPKNFSLSMLSKRLSRRYLNVI